MKVRQARVPCFHASMAFKDVQLSGSDGVCPGHSANKILEPQFFEKCCLMAVWLRVQDTAAALLRAVTCTYHTIGSCTE